MLTATNLLIALVAIHGSVLNAIYEEDLTNNTTPAEIRELADTLIKVSALAPDGWADSEDVEPYDLYALWMADLLESEPVCEAGRVRVVLA